MKRSETCRNLYRIYGIFPSGVDDDAEIVNRCVRKSYNRCGENKMWGKNSFFQFDMAKRKTLFFFCPPPFFHSMEYTAAAVGFFTVEGMALQWVLFMKRCSLGNTAIHIRQLKSFKTITFHYLDAFCLRHNHVELF